MDKSDPKFIMYPNFKVGGWEGWWQGLVCLYQVNFILSFSQEPILWRRWIHPHIPHILAAPSCRKEQQSARDVKVMYILNSKLSLEKGVKIV